MEWRDDYDHFIHPSWTPGVAGGHFVAEHLAADPEGPVPFSFNASHYTQEELTEKQHNYELEACGSTVLCLDYALNGIGSNSCGPRLMKQYEFNDTEFTFSLKLVPNTFPVLT